MELKESRNKEPHNQNGARSSAYVTRGPEHDVQHS